MSDNRVLYVEILPTPFILRIWRVCDNIYVVSIRNLRQSLLPYTVYCRFDNFEVICLILDFVKTNLNFILNQQRWIWNF